MIAAFGAGKSSLLHSGAFQDEPSHQLKHRSAVQKRHTRFVFQSCRLRTALSPTENLEIPLSYRDVSRWQREARVPEILDRFQNLAKTDPYPNQLSNGQQQLVGVPRVLIRLRTNGPEICIRAEAQRAWSCSGL